MSGSYGKMIKMTIFGESHGPSIGLVIDGLPPGIIINEEAIKQEMMRRAPGQSALSTERRERDQFVIQSGVFEGRTTGTPLCALIANSDTRSGDYSYLKDIMRPGHADLGGKIRAQGFNDYRGGGHFSGRLTAPLVLLGAIARQVLEERGITIGTHIAAIGEVQDGVFDPVTVSETVLTRLRQMSFPVLDLKQAEKMQSVILQAKAAGDSVGGVVECAITGMPAGIGEPFFDSLESVLAHALFSIPAVKGLEFGAGFALAKMLGSAANDAMYYEGASVKARTNHNGGIIGGITNGMPIIFRTAFKPTPSISVPQESVNVVTQQSTQLVIQGRHDPCIVPRALPVVESIAAWMLLDMLLLSEKRRW
ncbi:MAG TPA: chorismate synthase [Candidatus Avacidaminococcus intestinavium]|uniref:Chorismate synthase n=1 Tax=Candidatus Avacidaminococcus intestinavium TaxID=2840684 RepID=A0A9D1MP74_9FIRM|nr:chorismate synthase [Candidatus Avacidaminococcus intestinavium]